MEGEKEEDYKGTEEQDICIVETPKCLHSQYTVQVFLCNKKKMN